MDTPLEAPSPRVIGQLGSLVRLAAVAWLRTAFANSAHLLAAGVTLVLLADGAWRVKAPGALDRWLVAALAATIVLPVVLAEADPLRSQRLALVPVPSPLLGRARAIAGAPLRLPFATWLVIAGGLSAFRVASGVAVLALVGWAMAACWAGAVLEAMWHRPRALPARAIAGAIATVGSASWWSLRGVAEADAMNALVSWVPTLLPREGGAIGWLTALAVCAASVAFGAWVLHASWWLATDTAARARRPKRAPAGASRWVYLPRVVGFPASLSPSVAREIALLTRHVGSRVALGAVAALSGAAAYGRVPGLALIAVVPMIMLTANALGADVALGGLVRHQLQPETLGAVRDRRLTVWAAATTLISMLAMGVGVALPAPQSVGAPAGGALAAPAMLLFGVSLIPWFGRAGWWWARRYPQPLARGISDVGASRAAFPVGPAHHAIGLLAAWVGVALVAGLLWSACHTLLRSVSATDLAIDASSPMVEHVAWQGAALLAGSVAAGTHLLLRATSRRGSGAAEVG